MANKLIGSMHNEGVSKTKELDGQVILVTTEGNGYETRGRDEANKYGGMFAIRDEKHTIHVGGIEGGFKAMPLEEFVEEEEKEPVIEFDEKDEISAIIREFKAVNDMQYAERAALCKKGYEFVTGNLDALENSLRSGKCQPKHVNQTIENIRKSQLRNTERQGSNPIKWYLENLRIPKALQHYYQRKVQK